MFKFLPCSFLSGNFMLFFILLFPVFLCAQNVTPFLGGGLFGVGAIYAMEYDSITDRTYIAGSFSSVNGIPANNVAVLDSGVWKPLGAGIASFVTAMKFWNGNLYVGGEFEYAGKVHARNIARWDGQNWFPVGNPEIFSVRISLMEVFQNQLYVSGNFQQLNNDPNIRYLARWDGASWKSTGWNHPFSPAGLTPRGDTLWAWGILTTSVSPVRHSTSFLHGTQWDTLPYIKNETDVNSLVFHKNRLLVTSYPNNFIYEWTANNWKLVEYYGSNINLKLVSYKEQLYGVADSFNPSTLIRKINGSQQVQAEIRLMNGKGYVQELNWKEIKNDLYFFGNFNFCNNLPCGSILKLSGGNWSHTDYVADAHIYNYSEGYTLLKAPDSGDWYVGGDFYIAGTAFSQNIARYDGSEWHSMGLGLNGMVTSIAWYKGQIYAVGRFYDSGPQHLTGLARWDGTEWQFCGDAAIFPRQLLVAGDKLYLVGSTNEIDGVYGGLFAYDGVQWTAPGNQSQFSSIPIISDIVHFQGKIIVASEFEPQEVWQFANGAWTQLYAYPGFQGQIVRLCVVNGALYAGARKPNQVLRWNGTIWVDMGYPYNGNSDNRIDGLFEFKGNLVVSTLSGCKIYQNGIWKPFIELEVNGLVPYDSTRYLCTGNFASGKFGNQMVALNNLALLDCEMPTASIKTDKDTACLEEFVHVEAISTGMGLSYEWQFPGGTPNTCLEPACSIKYAAPGIYPVYLSYSNLGGMDSTSYQMVVLPCMVQTALPENEPSLLVFPNPVRRFLNVRIQDATQSFVQISDATGKLSKLWHYQADTPIDVSALPPGCYFLQIQGAEHRYNARFIKE